MTQPVICHGRFAPSPTGDLHYGSLLAAMASYCDVRHRHGHWTVRIEDIDPPRAIEGAAERFPASIERLGMAWDALWYQRTHLPLFRQALARLNAAGLLYRCDCTRKSLRGLPAYPGTCRPPHPEPLNDHALFDDTRVAIRCRLDTYPAFVERVQTLDHARLRRHFGDPIVRRRDGLFAYPLAAAVDDSHPVTDVVRGADLLDTTPAQVALIELLGGQVPHYAHLPTATGADGSKLSKQTGAAPIDREPVLPLLQSAWRFLGQSELDAASVTEFWQAAAQHWCIDKVPSVPQAPGNHRPTV